ncbi:hypothetical protein [uncultured Nitratireductor sp.]|uniref:hypothetical protein n=1 Tax=uncultured Nitratireductor sp. TaxID=520953 RepID=UPI0025E17CE1|nr:hypothetical protein [uncultured Nitratireductor sp.]
MRADMPGRLVPLKICDGVIEAKLYVSMLKAYGIYAFAATEFAGTVPYMRAPTEGIELKVVDTDLEAARELLTQIDADQSDSPKGA